MNILPISEHHLEYAKKVYEKLESAGIRVSIDDRNEKLGYKMRESQTKKIPFNLILGDEEGKNETVSYRRYQSKDTTTVTVDEFITMIESEIKNKTCYSK